MTNKLFIAAISVLFTFLTLSLGLLLYTIVTDVISAYGLIGVVVIVLAATIFSVVYRKIKNEWESG